MPDSFRTRVKICGITRPQDALAAADAGADAIGLVFYAASPRAITVDTARRIVAVLPPFVSATGLFVNAQAEDIKEVLSKVPLDLLQFHGDESPGFCASFGLPWIKAIRVRPDAYTEAVLESMQEFTAARGILLDAWHEHLFGGSGKTIDWSLLAQDRLASKTPLILAGGLAPGNVGEAIRMVRPWAVDVSTGVEEAPGLKSRQLINAFMQEVQRV